MATETWGYLFAGIALGIRGEGVRIANGRISGHQRMRASHQLLPLLRLLPWWVCILIAAASYFVADAVASREFDPTRPMTAVVTGLATGARLALPILFLALAAASAITRATRRDLFERASNAGGSQAIASMDWSAFEALLGEAYRRQGYRVIETGMGGADGGVDLALKRDGALTLVQCKHWRSSKVGVTVVRELLGVMTAKKAAAGIVVTSGRFTDEARRFAHANGVDLVDGEALGEMLAKVKQAGGVGRDTGRQPSAPPTVAAPIERAVAPACPSCGKPMVRRVAGKGQNAGRAFWGCVDFPRCRGTRPLDDRSA